ncbi:hypothetical protein PMI28_00406 [Pseudomonas sp. GM48]|nr:hypothetical protein PMI28_00406 [Pseudomonas sp. GM48]
MPISQATTQSVAAGVACVRLRSSRKISVRGTSQKIVQAGFTTAAQPDAAFGSCYKEGVASGFA